MIISYREKQLIRNAENPNVNPWNVSPSSREGLDGRDDQSQAYPQKIVNIKIDKDRNQVLKHRQLLNWETYNQFEDQIPESESEEEKENEEEDLQ